MRNTKTRYPSGVVTGLLRRGLRTLAVERATERPCRVCGQPFFGSYVPELQAVCAACVEENVRLTQAQLREARVEEGRRTLAALGIDGRLAGCTFGAFVADWQPEALAAAREVANAWPTPRNLALLGDRGTGKTHLGVAIVQAISAAYGERGRYVYLPGLLAKLAMAKDWQAASTELVDPLTRTPVLVLDDVGRERTKDDAAWPMLKDTLLDRRWVGGFPTVLCANLSRPELLAWLGDVGTSRFFETGKVVLLRAGDRRLNRPPAAPPALIADPTTACAACAGSGWVVDRSWPVGHPSRALRCPACNGRGW